MILKDISEFVFCCFFFSFKSFASFLFFFSLSPVMPDGLDIKIKQFYGLWRGAAFGFHKHAATFRKLAALFQCHKSENVTADQEGRLCV